MPADMILLGLVIVGFVVAVPVTVGIVAVLLFGGPRPRARGRRSAQ